MSGCELCPRRCGVSREIEEGFCGQGTALRIAHAGLHFWEEPCISGTKGAGTVFFSGCGLKCVYCQNFEVSRGKGYYITEGELESIFLRLQEEGAHNISLVTPSHFLTPILRVLDRVKHRLEIPVVYNTGGYEREETVKSLEGYIDIYMPDLKYKSAALAERYSACPDYFEKAAPAILEMARQQPYPALDEKGIMKGGLIVRHLALPGAREDSLDVLNWLGEKLPAQSFLLSLMSQYTPMPSCCELPEINRRLTKLEYRRVSERAELLGFKGYFQGMTSSSTSFIPPFKGDVKQE